MQMSQMPMGFLIEERSALRQIPFSLSVSFGRLARIKPVTSWIIFNQLYPLDIGISLSTKLNHAKESFSSDWFWIIVAF